MPEPSCGYISVCDWVKYQHYRDRAPPWIKLHNYLLDDYRFTVLSDAGKFHLLAIMMLASRSGNRIIADAKWIAGRIGAKSPINLSELLESQFIEREQSCSETLAGCEHDASKPLERGRAEESRAEESRAEGEGTRKQAGEKYQLPTDWQPSIETINTLTAKGYTAHEISWERDRFVDHFAGGERRAGWDRSFRNWVTRNKPGTSGGAPRGYANGRPKGGRQTDGSITGAVAFLTREAEGPGDHE